MARTRLRMFQALGSLGKCSGAPTHPESGELDDLPGRGRMDRDKPALAEVEDVACVGQLVLMLDRDDLVPLVTDELAELKVRPGEKL